MPEAQPQIQWRTVLELHKPYLALTLKTTEVKGKRYVMVFADDFSEWKEFAIYTATDEKIEEIVRKIQALVEKAEDDPQYDPVPEIAAMIAELIDTFIIGEIPEEAGICSEDEYVAYPEEDERLNWPLCYDPSAVQHLQVLERYNLLPEEWVPHVQKVLAGTSRG